MKSYLTFEPGVPELEEFAPHCWVHVECPDEDDFMFLTKELGIPREFLSDIADIDERPRAEHNIVTTATRNIAAQESDVPSGVDLSKVGRNELCPCGSGKKFKNCHGRR